MNLNEVKERPQMCAAGGAKTKYVRVGSGHFKECRACGTRIREDLQEHPFFGWNASCGAAKDDANG